MKNNVGQVIKLHTLFDLVSTRYEEINCWKKLQIYDFSSFVFPTIQFGKYMSDIW